MPPPSGWFRFLNLVELFRNSKHLRYERLRTAGLVGTGTVTCTIEGQTMSRSMPTPWFRGADGAAEYDVRIALKSGARTIIPVRSPAPGVTMDVTLDLSYEEEQRVALLRLLGQQ